MNTMDDSLNNSETEEHQSNTSEMSIDGCPTEKASSPHITYRKGTITQDADLRTELRSFQNDLLATLKSWCQKQDEKLSKFLEDFVEIKASTKFLSDKYDELHTKTLEVQNRICKIETKLKTYTDSERRLELLEDRLHKMEQDARQSNLEISNLPEKRNEDLVTIFDNISSIIKLPISQQDIVTIHRVPQASPQNPRPKNIIVKFTSRTLRDNFLAAARKLRGITSDQLGINGSSQKIYFNEHLTLHNKSLFREAREKAKESNFKFTWIKHGTILVRASDNSPVFAVRSREDLLKFNRR